MIKNILLAEDERGTALLVKNQLELKGYVVHVVPNGLEALEVLKREQIDLVVTDVVMPYMDGVDLYIELKSDQRTAKLPIIIITDKQVFLDSFSALGVNHFLPKTFDVEVLVEKINGIERQALQNKDYRKVLVCGEDAAVLLQIQSILRERECLVTSAKTTLEIVTKAIEMRPHLILMDVMLRQNARAKELVRSLKCYDFLQNTKIVLYSYFSPEQANENAGLMPLLEDAIKEGLEAGASRYLGRFNRLTFLAQLEDLGIK